MKYSKIIITNLPAFYKINLFNKIVKQQDILVVFTGNTGEIRNADFFKKDLINFDYIDLNQKSLFYKIYTLFKLIYFTTYIELIIGGWDEPILLLSSILSQKKKNSVIVESSIYESQISGSKAFVKRIFLKRIHRAYASGNAQIKLLAALGFKGKIIKTKGVGIFNINEQPIFEERKEVTNFLYVGRLSEEKNLEKLVLAFDIFPQLTLNMVGFGPLEDHLKMIAPKNVIFHGAINNLELYKYYRSYDVFILPSLIEPWGLVIEEAMNNGMPVIVSNKVGCSDEIIINEQNGLIFNVDEEEELTIAIRKITNILVYNKLRKKISDMNFISIAQEQVDAYLH